MYNISTKYNRSLFVILKIAIVAASIYYIYSKLTVNELLSFSVFWDQILFVFSNNIWALIIVFLLTDINWILEIFKWKLLVSTVKKINFLEAYEQCFASHAISIITPNRIGEYPAKAFYFKAEFRKKIIGLNFVSNMAQLIATIFFGIFGFSFFILKFNPLLPEFTIEQIVIYLVLGILLITAFLKLSKHFNLFKRFTLFRQKIPQNIYNKTILFSFLRYLVFSHQYLLLLRLFGVETAYLTLLILIFTIYLLASIIPVISLFDWAIKGSIALFIFQFVEINELTIITVATLMWILNFAIPALIGSIFVLNFKLKSAK